MLVKGAHIICPKIHTHDFVVFCFVVVVLSVHHALMLHIYPPHSFKKNLGLLFAGTVNNIIILFTYSFFLNTIIIPLPVKQSWYEIWVKYGYNNTQNTVCIICIYIYIYILHAVFALSAGPRPSATKNWAGPASFPFGPASFSSFSCLKIFKDEFRAGKFWNLNAKTVHVQGKIVMLWYMVWVA